jgi:uncharacterized protein (TIGR02145 family)
MKTLFKVPGIILTIILISSCEDKPVVPVLSTTSVSGITTTTATSGGSITSDGGATVISEGVCWNTSADPTIDNNKTTENSGAVTFTGNITQLSPNTKYYVRAFATNSAGTGYGNSVSFSTLGNKPSSNNLSASNITINTAILNGTVNPNFLSTTVTFEYGISSSYGSSFAALQSPIASDADGNVSLALSALNPGTTYHFRIKAENSLGVSFSDDMTFTTLGLKPTIFSVTFPEITTNKVVLKGIINPNYLSSAIAIEYGLTNSYGSSVSPSQSPLTGSTTIDVITSITGLTPGTKYFFRIKAVNELGTTYSEESSCTTFSAMDFDNNGYHSVKINSQEWLSENLRVTHFQNGDAIPNIASDAEWSTQTSAAYSIYKNENANSLIYGNIYNFYVAKDSRNVCPTGWHVPTLDEWHTLVTYLGGDSIADESLREAGTAHWLNNTGATNSTGFTLLPAGNRESDGRFFNLHSRALVWSSFDDYENTVHRCWNIGMEWNVSKIIWSPYSDQYGASIRCLKD